LSERQKEIERLGARLDPALRTFIDRVIVPALVREYIADRQNGLAAGARAVAQSEASNALSAEGVQ
jgi:hypothetical protein